MNITPLDLAARGSTGEAGRGTDAEAGPSPTLLSTCLASSDLNKKSSFSLTGCLTRAVRNPVVTLMSSRCIEGMAFSLHQSTVLLIGLAGLCGTVIVIVTLGGDGEYTVGGSAGVLSHRTSPEHQNLASSTDFYSKKCFLLQQGMFSQVIISSHRKPLWQSWHGLS